MQVKVKKLMESATIPTRGSLSAAGYDLYSTNDENVVIQPHQTLMMPTGIAMEIPEGYFGAVFARSGLASKRGLRPANCVAVIDSDYRGDITVALHNDTDEPKELGAHERMAQIVIMPYLAIDMIETDELSTTERGTGGFGSTGKN